MIFKGEELYDDTHTLSEYNIKKKSTLYLMVDKEIESEEEEDRDDGWKAQISLTMKKNIHRNQPPTLLEIQYRRR